MPGPENRIGWSLTGADFLQRTGAGPVEARIISRGFNISWRGGPALENNPRSGAPFLDSQSVDRGEWRIGAFSIWNIVVAHH